VESQRRRSFGIVRGIATNTKSRALRPSFVANNAASQALSADGTHDAAGLAVPLGAWGAGKGDVTCDGTTDAQDLAILLGSCGA
jgi:hypothetical protein